MGDPGFQSKNKGHCYCLRPELIFEKQFKFMFKCRGKTRQGSQACKLRCLQCGGFKWWHPTDPRLETLTKDRLIHLAAETISEAEGDDDPYLKLVSKELGEIKEWIKKNS